MNHIKVDLEQIKKLIEPKMPGARVEEQNNTIAVPVTLRLSPGFAHGNGWRWYLDLQDGRCIGVGYMSGNDLAYYETCPRKVAKAFLSDWLRGVIDGRTRVKPAGSAKHPEVAA